MAWYPYCCVTYIITSWLTSDLFDQTENATNNADEVASEPCKVRGMALIYDETRCRGLEGTYPRRRVPLVLDAWTSVPPRKDNVHTQLRDW
jgi:hypothetical protein